ncbi:MAG: right-handed parallel beta-helix repeat-containing protein [Acidobacteria bacterium]|nr:right-handed parallel beta-helix repeat-containing protein [Acidobacteriota bacterium]
MRGGSTIAVFAACVAWFGMQQRSAAASNGSILFVDDDGAQCPGAFRTIQEAVAQAAPGSTILVCPGIYRKTVKLSGKDNEGMQLIALGHPGDVVLQGDHTEPFGFHLQDVENVLIRGFTVLDFGNKPTTASQYGNGCAIHLANSNYNTVENNRLSRADMTGINVLNSAHNIIRYNLISEIDPKGFGNGIWLQGKRTSGNLVFQNYAYLQPGAGIIVWNAGEDNVITDNAFNNNGQWGISHRDTAGTLIEGNRFSYNAGNWGVITFLNDRRSIGIELRNSDRVVLRGNMASNNTRLDISWDKKGDVVFADNACAVADQAGLCGHN